MVSCILIRVSAFQLSFGGGVPVHCLVKNLRMVHLYPSHPSGQLHTPGLVQTPPFRQDCLQIAVE